VPIFDTKFGIDIDINALQPMNALARIVVSDCGSVIDVNAIQLENALIPIVVND
jgi:hypothetical protein